MATNYMVCIRVTNENHNPIQTSILCYQNFIFPYGFRKLFDVLVFYDILYIPQYFKLTLTDSFAIPSISAGTNTGRALLR